MFPADSIPFTTLRRALFFSIAAVIAVSTTLLAQTEQPQVQVQRYKILGVSVEGNKQADAAAIIANSGLKVGDELAVPGDQTRTAISRLWSLRIFSDIQIINERTVEGGVYLLIRVKEYPRLERVEIKGADEISESDLMKKITLLKGQVITPQETNSVVKTIKKAYDDDGYLQATITPELIEDPDSAARGRQILRITIDEGNEVRIGTIRFYGNKAFDASDLRGTFDDTHEKVWWMFWRSSKFDKKKYGDDKQKLIEFYHAHGYRDAEILADSITYDESKEYLTLTLYLYEGPQYRIRNITWDGNSVFKTDQLNARLGFQKGDIYDLDKFNKNLRQNEDQTDVYSLYLDNGYLFVSIDPEEVNVPGDSVDIVMHVREHNQFRIGQVEIQGNTKTQERVIRRELYTRPGDYFSRSNIIRSIRQLSQLQYFNPEKIKPDTRIVDDKTVDVIYDVEEKSNDTFNMSVGYSGIIGFTGALGLTFNNFYLAEPLAGGGGQILNFDWQFGESNTYQTFSVSFREPWLFDTPTSLGFSVYDTKQNVYYPVHQTGGTVSIGRKFRWPDDYFRGDWIFGYQRLDVPEESAYYDRTGVTTLFNLTQVLTRNSIDNPLFPTQGSNISLSTELAGPPFLPGTAEYTKHILTVDWYAPLFNSPKFALYFGSLFGEIYQFKKSSYIPYIETFIMGGTGLGYVSTTPLRGYADQSIRPLQANGAPERGLVMQKETAELRFNVSLNPIPIYLLAFAEGGNVWKDVRSTDLFSLNRSAGFGARLLINPIGLLGFDYGYGFDNPSGTGGPSGWHFHFQFGRGF